MKVLINVRDLIFHEDSQSANIAAVFPVVAALFEETATISDAYLHQDPLDCVGKCVFGYQDRGAILSEAKGWNAEIRTEFEQALKVFTEEWQKNGCVPLDNTITYRLKKAVMAIDNSFYDFCEHAVALKTTSSYLSTLISDDELAEILESPENYAILEVYPK